MKDYKNQLWSNYFESHYKDVNEFTEISYKQTVKVYHYNYGILISKELIKKIGFPKKEMFIWGDETEYYLRALRSGMGVATVIDAIFYHPQNRMHKAKIAGIGYEVNYSGNTLRDYCMIRNHAYIITRYFGLIGLLKFFTKYSMFFCLH